MRRLLIAVALVGASIGCGASKASGPKWPEPSKTADDGGESIEPRPSVTYAAVVEKSADADDGKSEPAAATATPAAATTDDKPATTPAAAQPASEDVIMTEEIIIEIDD